ncbi:uncharacterized protein LOC117589305 isoform X4 [Drosophila guanche]|uniref:uncharacterized protein LOC117589305 isoform X4 n=1 Tax=Drosophila guanche TaxID=7266 RepID=UPI0014710849|nr:uncharacterized protein LOC117589305 isoform X4 [Drosophila guanche]
MSCWYLEHLSTQERVILPKGKSTIGRHSACRIVLNYAFMSREHVEMSVNSNAVLVKCLNASNGVFVNNAKIQKKPDGVPVSEGDLISLGCPLLEKKCSKKWAVFSLKKVPVQTEEIVLSSDSEDELLTRPPPKSAVECKVEPVEKTANIPSEATTAAKETEKEGPTTSKAGTHPILHLPKVPQVKAEWVKTAQDITSIFGEADEAIIGSVLSINPYLYNHLPKEKQALPVANLLDGQVIELEDNEDNNKAKDPPCQQANETAGSMLPPCPHPPLSAQAVDDYDEDMAMSQAVLQEMKDEMAFSDGEENFFELTNNECSHRSSSLSPLNDEEDVIVISDSDDDDLCSKVADWSNKLLSQKTPDALSQSYPLTESDAEEDFQSQMQFRILPKALRMLDSSDDEEDVPSSRLFPKYSKPLRIDSSSDEDDSSTPNIHKADKAALKPSLLRSKSVGTTEDECQLFTRRPRKDQADTIPETALSSEDDWDNWDNWDFGNMINEALNGVSSLDETIPDASKKSKIVQTPEKIALDISMEIELLANPITEEADVSAPEKTPSPKKANVEPVMACKYNKKSRISSRRSTIAVSFEDLAETSLETPKESPQTTVKVEPAVSKHHSKLKASSMEIEASSVEKAEAEQPAADSKKSRIVHRRLCVTVSREELLGTLKEKPKDVPLVNKTTRRSTVAVSHEEFAETCSMEPKEAPSVDKAKDKVESAVVKSSKENEPAAKPKEKSPSKKEPNARLRSRAISCYYEKPQDEPDLVTSIVSGMDMKQIRRPEVIEAPSLPKYRGKLRGVSAVPKAKILDHQRFLDYQAEMNAKWKEKPKAKNPVDVETKEKRREALKKLTEKKPVEGEHAPGSSKRKATTTVPKVANSNRGAFLTESINGLPPSKVAKLDAPEPPLKNRRATIDSETFSQQIKAPDSLPLPRRNWRPPERKEAEYARNQRTCNRTTFASMEKDMEEKLRCQKMSKRVRFNDKPVIYFVEKYIGQSPMHGVNGRKDTELLFFSTYAERRERWSSLQVNDKTSHFETILKWSNQWLKQRSVDAVADSDVLKPIAAEFENVKQYKENFVPLMKLELLTTIERDYKLGRPSFEVCLQQPVEVTKSFYCLTTRVFINPPAKYMLYTLSSGDKLPETFATLREQRTKNAGQELIFEILKDGISLETLNGIKLLTARPVVDSLRVDLGALRAVDQLARSPLHRRIIKPTEMLKNASIPSYGTPFVFKGFAKLNPHQELVCASTYQRVIDDSKPSITLIQGPPGTGKSMIIANISFQCLYGKAAIKKDRKILICAHSNTAVDSIVSRLHQVRENFSEQDRFEMLRYGLHEKMSSLSRHYSLEHKYQCARNHKRDRISADNRVILKQHYNELQAEVNEMRNTHLNGTWLFDQYQEKIRKLQIFEDKLNPRLTQREEFDIASSHIKAANIVCTTLSSCVKLSSYINYFDVCLIDEATQCTEPWTLLPMRFGIPHLVLVGDTQQLPAVVLSQRAVEFGLARSMFDRIQRSLERQQADDPLGHLSVHTKLFKLTTQYRMHPEICKWPNRYFYDAQLVNEVGLEGKLATPLIPYAIINLGFTRDTSDPKTRSISNEEEARFVAKLLAEMEKHLPSRRYGYGLISPYSSQCYALSQVLPSHMNLPPPLTVDAYQGTESDVVVISNARTQGCGFLSNYQRLNVAVTRPKRCLIICGNFKDLQNVPMWRDLLDDACKRGVYFDLKREDVANLKDSLMSKLLVKPPVNEE